MLGQDSRPHMSLDYCFFKSRSYRASRSSRIRDGSDWQAYCHMGGAGMTTVTKQGPEALNVAELVARAADGDRRAWERLVDQFARLIWSITADFKLTESDASDVAQTTWLRLLEHIHRIEHPDRVGSWLAATARNE